TVRARSSSRTVSTSWKGKARAWIPLAGWVAACVGQTWHPLGGIAVLAVAFPLVALGERAAWRRGWVPPGYMGVRWIVTAITECCLLMVLLVRFL
ncbi:DUF3429 family protein, partial [Acetobacter okinawensis]|uniref:DUF3429 domain-containing protein n=1 Tax=Acetobacter okinawensis TaxID=1076594 RepID=UPI001BAAE46C